MHSSLIRVIFSSSSSKRLCLSFLFHMLIKTQARHLSYVLILILLSLSCFFLLRQIYLYVTQENYSIVCCVVLNCLGGERTTSWICSISLFKENMSTGRGRDDDERVMHCERVSNEETWKVSLTRCVDSNEIASVDRNLMPSCNLLKIIFHIIGMVVSDVTRTFMNSCIGNN